MDHYEFDGRDYKTMAALAAAMAADWARGREFLLSGALRAAAAGSDKRAAASAMWAEKKYREDPSKGNLLFLKWLVKTPGVTDLYWMGRCYGDLDHVLKLTESDENEETTRLVLYMIQEQIFGDFVQTSGKKESVTASVRFLERCYSKKETRFNRRNILPLMRAVLSENRIFEFDGKQFGNVQDLAAYLQTFADRSKKSLSGKAAQLYQDDANLIPEFEAWLLLLGYQKALSAWKDRFQAGAAQDSFDDDLVLLEDVELREEAQGEGGADFGRRAEKFEEAFTKMLSENPESLENADRFRAFMADLMPDSDLQIYLIHTLYKMDIARAIREAEEISELFPARFIGRMTGDFGVSAGLARWAVSVWCVCYGERVLKKRNRVAMYISGVSDF